MKKLLLLILVMPLMATQCEDRYYETNYEPVLMVRSELETSIKMVAPKPLTSTGKIYVKDNFLFIGEKFEGVHVIDNSDPLNPIPVGFITIPGNIDISIKGDIFYADNSVDLVAFRLVDKSIQILDRNIGVFPELAPPDGFGIPSEYTPQNRPPNTLIVKWIEK